MTKQKKSVTRAYNSKAHPKRQNQSQKFHKVYWPFIPSLLMIAISGLMIFNTPVQQAAQNSVLAYATEMSRSGLLSGHNSERTSRGLGSLAINSKLNNAAQAKAEDMKERDYWSHNTPDGKEPWYFISQAEYAYNKAGENLAYGFATSSATITGWMNSAGHRANVLNTDYTEVGFGFVDAPNFVGTGNETIVVAMYGQPRVQSAATTSPTPVAAAPKPAPKVATAKPTPAAQPSAPTPVTLPPEVAVPSPVDEPIEQKTEELAPETPYTSDVAAGSENKTTRITRIQSWTNGAAPWSAAVLSLSAIVLAGVWIGKHALIVKRALVHGEDWVLHHPLVDFAVLSFITLVIYLTSTIGIIR
ncbi:MAG: CAP domain-containing protein [bacterium]|nr:CAP domain-containing protein [bacterium]